jgi:DNA (cytosine-5)-methyltransferase 1
MGLPDTYKLPVNYNDAYHITGDGVVVPVVRHLASYLFEPILSFRRRIDDACGASA